MRHRSWAKRIARFLSRLIALFTMMLRLDADAQTEIVRFDLPAQPLAASLRAVADTTGINVLFDTAKVAGRKAPALSTALSADEALSILLAGSGLRHHFIDDKTVILETDSAPSSD